jgi:hypothetical protein
MKRIKSALNLEKNAKNLEKITMKIRARWVKLANATSHPYSHSVFNGFPLLPCGAG